MKIAGIEKCSFVDYPGHLAAVFFTPGCNWDCYYCHNRILVETDAPRPWLDREVALAWLDDRKEMLDGVVITGGEPTIQGGLAEFIAQVHAKGYPVKLDTNGSRPTVLATLLERGLLDYVAMDVKAPMDQYDAFTGVRVEHDAINESIDRLLNSHIDYEFRTTVTPQLSHDDILAIARRVHGAKRYVLQQYRRPADCSDPRIEEIPHLKTWPAEIWTDLQNLVGECCLRGFEVPVEREVLVA